MKMQFIVSSLLNYRKITAVLSFVALLALGACNQNSGNEPAPSDKGLTRIVQSQEEFDRAMNARTKATGPQFTIENVTRDGNILTVKVKGGCSAESFKAVWNGVEIMIYPPTIHIALTHEAGEVTGCPTDLEHTIKIDITKVVGEGDHSNTTFVVYNGSKVQDTTLNPDGSVSNR
ncbi:hypothetical protein [Larkinella terrae]|uniref:Lipoprotein n=1 Tax=Larkinella terrae TaxID=2025311 RepID=A0A7K0EI27_9BACT|nr:hypothetical protein [Larkinella terrae]MRS61500.1 hypothetical protein [Larkinella terrae]